MVKQKLSFFNGLRTSHTWDDQTLRHRAETEDILKALYHSEDTQQPIHVQSLCKMAQIQASQLPILFKEMSQQGLVTSANYQLTEKGRKQALSIIRRHRLYETYLSEHSGYGPTKWHKIAHEKEHHLSSDDTERLNSLLGNPLFDPHGDPIPTALTLSLPNSNKILCPRLEVGMWIYVQHIEDDNADTYRALTELRIAKGSVFFIQDINNVFLQIFLEGEVIELYKELLSALDLREATKEEVTRMGDLHIKPLTILQDDQEATIHTISPFCKGLQRRRLMDLGFVCGSHIIIDVHSPMGNPTAYLIRGSAIALRHDQARHILIKNIKSIES